MAADQFTANDPALPATARLVPDFPDYCVTPDGVLYSRDGRGGGKNARPRSERPWRQMKPSQMRNGYLAITMYRPGSKAVNRKVHALVLEAFVGPCPEGMEILHANGDRADNRLGNLSYGTHRANYADSVEHGTAAIGLNNGMSKLTPSIVQEIRRLAASGTPGHEVVARYQGIIGRSSVYRIMNRRSWRHID